MSKTKIEFDYKDKHYVLEYTAESLKQMERGGFNFATLGERVLSAAEDLFYGAFLANHKDTPQELAKEIYEAIEAESDGESLRAALDEMVAEAIESIGNKKGNLHWKVVR